MDSRGQLQNELNHHKKRMRMQKNGNHFVFSAGHFESLSFLSLLDSGYEKNWSIFITYIFKGRGFKRSVCTFVCVISCTCLIGEFFFLLRKWYVQNQNRIDFLFNTGFTYSNVVNQYKCILAQQKQKAEISAYIRRARSWQKNPLKLVLCERYFYSTEGILFCSC